MSASVPPWSCPSSCLAGGCAHSLPEAAPGQRSPRDRSLNVLLWSSIPVLLFSCNILSSPWLAWIPEKLPVWYPVCAPGRFAWVFFFTYGLTRGLRIDHYLIGARSGRWVWWLRALAILLPGLWGYEGYTALRIQKDKPVKAE